MIDFYPKKFNRTRSIRWFCSLFPVHFWLSGSCCPSITSWSGTAQNSVFLLKGSHLAWTTEVFSASHREMVITCSQMIQASPVFFSGSQMIFVCFSFQILRRTRKKTKMKSRQIL